MAVRLTQRGRALRDFLAVLALGTIITIFLIACWSIGNR